MRTHADQLTTALRERYLDLLIGALTHTLYADVDAIEPPAELFDAGGMFTLEEYRQRADFALERAEGRDWPRHGQTMIGLKRMRNIRDCVQAIVTDDVPGDLIEAGVWRGGASILMRGALEAFGDDQRHVWLADSFQGLPEPDLERYPADADQAWAQSLDVLAVSVEQVRDNFRRYGLLDDRVHFVEGWFSDTLPGLRDRTWGMIRLDGDMYESTMDGLVNLYDGLAPGGFLLVDDYALPSCREAVDDFRREHGIDDPIERIDWTGVFWRKRG
ncbi:MAG TPA: TylF/MycF/NovP-related O-methyltransferase [Thermoleophilaceae bacterium]